MSDENEVSRRGLMMRVPTTGAILLMGCDGKSTSGDEVTTTPNLSGYGSPTVTGTTMSMATATRTTTASKTAMSANESAETATAIDSAPSRGGDGGDGFPSTKTPTATETPTETPTDDPDAEYSSGYSNTSYGAPSE